MLGLFDHKLGNPLLSEIDRVNSFRSNMCMPNGIASVEYFNSKLGYSNIDRGSGGSFPDFCVINRIFRVFFLSHKMLKL